jgi:hypothetical protein
MNAKLCEIRHKNPQHEKIILLSMFGTSLCLEDLGVDGKIMLKWIVQYLEREGVHWTPLA